MKGYLEYIPASLSHKTFKNQMLYDQLPITQTIAKGRKGKKHLNRD